MLNNNQKEAISILQKAIPEIAIGGSICLNAYGLLDREIGDIDCFVNRDSKLNVKALKEAEFVELDESYNFTTDFNGDTLDRLPLVIKGVKVCIFRVPLYLLSAVKMDIDGIEINIQNPCFALAGKVSFSKHDPKHIKDLDIIRSKLLQISLL